MSRDQITKANLAGSLGITLQDMISYGGNGVNKPATGVTWHEAAKYVNWLNTSQGYQAAYKFVSGTFTLWSAGDAGYDANNMYRNNLAKYVIASSNEWYKAAYGNPNGSWSNYANGGDSPPTTVAGGTVANTAVYGPQSGPADITNAGGLSPYGTMAQAGNVWEWNETAWTDNAYEAYYGTNNKADAWRGLRGDAWYSYSDLSNPSNVYYWGMPTSDEIGIGFRVAMIPGKESVTLYLFTAVDQTKGAVTLSPNRSSYLTGDLVTVSASPLPGYVFSSWSGDISGTTASATVAMDSNKNITANFGEDTRDSDADGLSNYQEIITYGTNPNQKDTNSDGVEDGQAVALGYSPTFNFGALTRYWQSNPPTGLYTASQMQAMAIGDLVLTKNASGVFVLNYDIEQSTDLQSWLPYQSFNQPLNNLPPDKAFIRIKAKQ